MRPISHRGPCFLSPSASPSSLASPLSGALFLLPHSRNSLALLPPLDTSTTKPPSLASLQPPPPSAPSSRNPNCAPQITHDENPKSLTLSLSPSTTSRLLSTPQPTTRRNPKTQIQTLTTVTTHPCNPNPRPQPIHPPSSSQRAITGSKSELKSEETTIYEFN